MKNMRRWIIALTALVLALMMAFAAFAEALPVEEPAEPFGSPWVNSVLIGNLPDAAPDLKDDFYTAVNYDELAANQGDTYYFPLVGGTAEVETALRTLLQDDSLDGNEIAQLKIFWEQAADIDALRSVGTSRVTPYLERINAAGSLDELNAVLTAEDFPFSPYLLMPVGPLALNEENGVWIYPALSMTVDFSSGANCYTEPVEDFDALWLKSGDLDRILYIRGTMINLGVDADVRESTAIELFNTEVSYVSKTYSDAAAAMADYGYISDALQRLSLEDLDSLCSRFPLTATLKNSERISRRAISCCIPTG